MKSSTHLDFNFWKEKNVFLTGHSGFKGSWMSHLLKTLGCRVYGYSLTPDTNPALFEQASVEKTLKKNTFADIRDRETLKKNLLESNADIIFHFAAQPLVRLSYENSFETFEINVMGTSSLLEAAKAMNRKVTIVVITTDKVYENREWQWGYREIDRLGGLDPYSASKAAAEIVVHSYRNSFFQEKLCGLATARAGNVIGGGDWSKDRIIPDIVRSVEEKRKLSIRKPHAIRPWQHVVEPLTGYLRLAQALYSNPNDFSSAWNFGPEEKDAVSVQEICAAAKRFFKDEFNFAIEESNSLHEAGFLKLDCSKSAAMLGIRPLLSIEKALELTFSWYQRHSSGTSATQLINEQIEYYLSLLSARN